MKKWIMLTAGLSVILFLNSPIAFSAPPDEGLFGDTTFEVGSWQMQLLPAEQPYPSYIADPRRPRMQFGVGAITSDVPERTNGVINLDAGTRITLLKMQKGSNEFALDVEGGLFTQFDMFNGLDNMGWDGRYGAYIAWDWSDLIVTRFGYRHLSAHLGDEYIEKTGRRRVNYTRDDFRIGIGYRFLKNSLIYVEPSYAWHLGNPDRQKKEAVEGGIQWEGPYTTWKGSMGFYAGLHMSAYRENDWNPSVTGQVGLNIKRDPRRTRLRIGLECYAGRAILGEYSLDYDEAYLTIGLFFDFF